MINLSILENSINYTCQVVRIKEIIDIPEADLIKQTIINNNSIIIGNHISEGFVIEKECYPTNNYYKAKNELYCLLEDRAQANEIPNIEDEN